MSQGSLSSELLANENQSSELARYLIQNKMTEIWALARYQFMETADNKLGHRVKTKEIKGRNQRQTCQIRKSGESHGGTVKKKIGERPIIACSDIRAVTVGNYKMVQTYDFREIDPVFISWQLLENGGIRETRNLIKETHGEKTLEDSITASENYQNILRQYKKLQCKEEIVEDMARLIYPIDDQKEEIRGIFINCLREALSDAASGYGLIVKNRRNIDEKIIKMINPTSTVVHCGNYGILYSDLLYASKKSDIKTLEIQHGLITPTHIAYNQNGTLTANNDYKQHMPDYMVTWNGYYEPIVASEILRVPSPVRHEINNYIKYTNWKKDIETKKGNFNVLYLTDYVDPKEIKKDILRLFIALEARKVKYILTVRFHPKDLAEEKDKEVIQELSGIIDELSKEKERVIKFSKPGDDLIRDVLECDYAVCGLSTCLNYLKEAGKDVLCVCKTGEDFVNKEYENTTAISRDTIKLDDFVRYLK